MSRRKKRTTRPRWAGRSPRGTPHPFVPDPEAPGTCRTCHVVDNPTQPRHAMHTAAEIARAEAEEAEIAKRQQQHRERTGERSI